MSELRRNVQCGYCGKWFYFRSSANRHAAQKHGRGPLIFIEIPNIPEVEKK